MRTGQTWPHFVVTIIVNIRQTNLISVVLWLHTAVGVDRQVIPEIILAVVRRFYSSTEEQYSLWTGIRP